MTSAVRHRSTPLAVGALALLMGSTLWVGSSPDVAGGRPAVPGGPTEVPSATSLTSVVTVKVGGDRAADGTVDPLAGAVLGLFATADATDPIDATWAQCTSDADGDCSFVIPDTRPGEANEGLRPYVRQIGVPDGWVVNPALQTGVGSGSSSEATAYQFQIPPLASGMTYSSTQDFMHSTARVPRASGGIWQQSRVNPALEASCGLDVALLFDLSSSVGSALPELKAAADTVVDSLVGTPSRLALFSFSGTSPGGATQNHPDLNPVWTAADARAVKAIYADWTPASGTNWDAGMRAVADASPVYDVAVVVTDGNPTDHGVPTRGDGSNTRLVEVENGIFSANAVKAEGTRMVVVGVGAGVKGVTSRNLAALSGPVAHDGTNGASADYVRVEDYAQVGAHVVGVLRHACQGVASVHV